jgi:hypothetical protein
MHSFLKHQAAKLPTRFHEDPKNFGKLSSAAGEATNLLKKGYATAFKGAQPRSLISEAAQAADGAANFSERIRASLPTITH